MALYTFKLYKSIGLKQNHLSLFSAFVTINQNNKTRVKFMPDTKRTICDFGLHKGEAYTKLPASFLTWMIAAKHQKSEYASKELKRRQQAATNRN